MTDPVIVVSHASKTFRRYHPDRPRTIQETLAKGLRRIRASERFWGLRDVSFSVGRGRTVGIIGANGSGKSTLLRLVGGIGKVDTGRIDVHGRICALLDLGSGFHPDLTGRENVIVSGVLAGLTRREVLQRFDAIVDFSEIEKFIDNPMRTYSTGMQMRLAFSTAVHTDPEVLLIDEVLSVGDTAFQNKCLERIAQFKASGCSILLVSHEASVVQELCDDALWLSAGRLMAHDKSAEVVRQYMAHMGTVVKVADHPDTTPLPAPSTLHPKLRTEQGTEVILDEKRFGSVELEIANVDLIDRAGVAVSDLASGDYLGLEIEYRAVEKVIAPVFQVRILREDGLVCFDINTERSKLSLSAVEGTGRLRLVLDRVDLNTGRYLIDVSAFANDRSYAYDHNAGVRSLVIRGDSAAPAVLDTPHRWIIPQA